MKLFLTLLLGVCSVAYGQTLRANTKVVLPDSTRDIASRLGDTASVKDFGAVADNATDATTAFNAALAAGKSVVSPAGSYFINGTVSVPANTELRLEPGTYRMGNSGKISLGSNSKLTCTGGADATIISIPSTYTVTDGVIVLGTTTGNQTIDGCQIAFAQPSGATTRAGMTAYTAWAVYASQAFGWTIRHAKITGAWNGINIANGSNNGKVLVDDLKLSSFNHGIEIDGSFDSVRINNLHWWPWGLVNGQFPAFFDVANVGIYSGKVDDMTISNSLFIGGLAMDFHVGLNGNNTNAHISNVAFDSHSGLAMSAGTVTIATSYFSIGGNGYRALDQSGGILELSACQFGIVTSNNDEQIKISGLARFYMSSSYVDIGANDITGLGIEGNTALANVVGNQFLRIPNTVFVNPTILVRGSSRLILADNYFTDKGTGTSAALTMTLDSWSIIHDNAFLGWSLALPASPTSLSVHNNTGVGP